MAVLHKFITVYHLPVASLFSSPITFVYSVCVCVCVCVLVLSVGVCVLLCPYYIQSKEHILSLSLFLHI